MFYQTDNNKIDAKLHDLEQTIVATSPQLQASYLMMNYIMIEIGDTIGIVENRAIYIAD